MPATKSGRTAPKCSDDEFIALFDRLGARRTSEILGGTERNVYARRRRLEERGIAILAPPSKSARMFPGCVPIELQNGSILVGSDFHIWPGQEPVCLRAFKKFVDDLKPSAVILNGDVMDFPRISHHPQSWETAPDPQEEIEAAQDHLQDIVDRCKRGAHKIWTIGNHDYRFEVAFATHNPQMRGVKGVHLADHFGAWQKAMSCSVNYGVESGRTTIKHRYKGGQHATYNNVRNSGCHYVTGHLHNQNLITVTDSRPFDLYGVDTGCVADKEHPAFSYTEGSPLNWRSGFALLKYRDWKLMCPELITKWDDNHVQFRGEVIRV